MPKKVTVKYWMQMPGSELVSEENAQFDVNKDNERYVFHVKKSLSKLHKLIPLQICTNLKKNPPSTNKIYQEWMCEFFITHLFRHNEEPNPWLNMTSCLHYTLTSLADSPSVLAHPTMTQMEQNYAVVYPQMAPVMLAESGHSCGQLCISPSPVWHCLVGWHTGMAAGHPRWSSDVCGRIKTFDFILLGE